MISESTLGLRILRILRSLEAFKILYVELCACKRKILYKWSFQVNINELIDTGSSDRKAGPAGCTYLNFNVNNVTSHAHLQNGLASSVGRYQKNQDGTVL